MYIYTVKITKAQNRLNESVKLPIALRFKSKRPLTENYIFKQAKAKLREKNADIKVKGINIVTESTGSATTGSYTYKVRIVKAKGRLNESVTKSLPKTLVVTSPEPLNENQVFRRAAMFTKKRFWAELKLADVISEKANNVDIKVLKLNKK